MEGSGPQITKEEARRKIQGLVELYLKEKTRSAGKFQEYNETNTKRVFIDKLFEALGWDMATLEEVSNEDKVSKGRVDYAFKLNGISKFFLEAKALNKGVIEQKDAIQAMNYAWYKGATWAVLTDFSNLFIYCAEVKGDLLNARFLGLSCEKFIDNFDELWLLSKPAFQEGLLDSAGEKWGKKRGRVKVGDQLLKDIMVFRRLLSSNIKANNPSDISKTDNEEAVQKILDRLIFIRTMEDRQYEERQLLQAARDDSHGKGHLTERLKRIYEYYDKFYDSKLFREHPDNHKVHHLCEDLKIDDFTLAKVINGLYESENTIAAYDFAEIDADVLGNMYEQYLSYILSNRGLEDNITNRKEQGIYYTPTYIVDYIVKNTLGELIKGKTPDEALKIRVLDPACGSGSFLIKAFDHLKTYHREKNSQWYAQSQIDSRKDPKNQNPESQILKNNIFGVDLDSKAVEIAQLNLLLKAATYHSLLPPLTENIKNGNSLIDDKAVAGEKAFKWETEFAEIMDEGKFDVIIGNPPYGAVISTAEKQYISSNYKAASGRFDTFYYFIEKSLYLLKNGGIFGLIVPDTWLTNYQSQTLRELLLNHSSIVQIVSLPQKVFTDANVDTCIIIAKKRQATDLHTKNKVSVRVMGKDVDLSNLRQNIFEKEFEVNQSEWFSDKRYLFNINQTSNTLVDKIKKDCVKLGDISEMCRGINPYAKSELIKKYGKEKGTEIVENRIWHSDKKKGDEFKKELVGSDIGRYNLDWKSGQWIKYGDWLSRARDPKFFTLPHILVQRIRNPRLKMRVVATFINPDDEYYNNSGLTNILSTKKEFSTNYILAILNSKLINWYYRQFFTDVNIKPEDLRELPIKKLSLASQNSLSNLATNMLLLNKKLIGLSDKHTSEYDRLMRERDETNQKIDVLVYDLYGLTNEERKTVNDAF